MPKVITVRSSNQKAPLCYQFPLIGMFVLNPEETLTYTFVTPSNFGYIFLWCLLRPKPVWSDTIHGNFILLFYCIVWCTFPEESLTTLQQSIYVSLSFSKGQGATRKETKQMSKSKVFLYTHYTFCF